MKPTRYILISAIAATAACQAHAQSLSQEIDVQHNVVVEHHDATRLTLTPRVTLDALKLKPLAFSERTVNIALDPTASFLEPTAYADTLATSPYDGYASIGYFPVYNLKASAGYRILNNGHSRLSAWMQFDGHSYNDDITLSPADNTPFDATIKRNTITAGLCYHLLLGRKSQLDMGLDYTFDRFNTPGSASPIGATAAYSLGNQSVNRINLNTMWMSSIGGLSYTVGADYHYFGYRRGAIAPQWLASPAPLDGHSELVVRPNRENRFNIHASGSLPVSETSQIGLLAAIDVINNTHHGWLNPSSSAPAGYLLGVSGGSYNHALITLRPRYKFRNNNFRAVIGARLDVTIKSGKAIHIAPDINVSWSPAAQFSIWAKALGGEHQNTLASLFDVNYMTAPMLSYRNSHIPVTIDAGIVVGPFKGAFIELFGGYAIANDWLMPIAMTTTAYGASAFAPVDIKGWHAGVALGYRHRYFDIKASAEGTPQKHNRGYYMWRDRAKWVTSASLTIKPIKPLNVEVSYSMRASRAIIDDNTDAHTRFNLGNSSMLNVNASYRVTPHLTVDASVENILNRRNLNLGFVPVQGITGLVGISYKF